MATKVFTSAQITLSTVIAGSGADVAAAGAAFTAMSGDTGTFTITTNTDNVGFGTTSPNLNAQILLIGTPIDDATVPPVITMTNVVVAFDYVISCGAGVPPPVTGDTTVIDNAIGGTAVVALDGTTSGTLTNSVSPPAYFGGTTRADLFTAAVVWADNLSWGNDNGAPIPFVAHTRRCAVSNFTLTITYTAPFSVTKVTPATGSVNGGQAVTITGTGFTSGTAAKFDGVLATSFVVVNDTTITAVTPEHASGLVDVEVVGVATGTGLYTYAIIAPKMPPMPVRTPIQQGKG